MRSRVRSIAAVGDKQRSRIGNICRNESENGADDESGQKPPRSSMRTVTHGESTDSRQPLQQTTPNPATASIRAGQGMRLRNRRTGPSFSPRRDTQRKLRRRPPIRRDAVRFNPANGAVWRHFQRPQRLTLSENFSMAVLGDCSAIVSALKLPFSGLFTGKTVVRCAKATRKKLQTARRVVL